MKAVQTQQKEKPADFAIDFTKIQPGVNRNLNLREEFRHRLDMATIRSTSILNGAFMDMLTGTAPFILCFLKIDGEELSARRLQNIMTELSGTPFGLLRPGGLGGLKGLIRVTQLFSPERGEIYPPWQGMQYMHNMYSGTPKFESLDNDRYPMEWTGARAVLGAHLGKNGNRK